MSVFLGLLFSSGSAQAWTVGGDSYNYRSPHISNATTANLVVNANDTYSPGVCFQNGSVCMYCKNSGCATGDISFGDCSDTPSEINWEDEITLTGNNPTSVYDSSFQAMYHFNNFFNDSTANANHGVNDGGTFVSGIFNNSVNLDGASNNVAVDGLVAELASDTEGTITLWMNIDTDQNSQNRIFTISRNADATITELDFHMDTRDGRDWVAANIQNDGVVQWNFHTAADSSDAWIGNWVHFALVQDGTEPSFYINGELFPNTFITSTDKTKWFKSILTDSSSKADNSTIGAVKRNGGSLGFIDAKIDDLRIYDRDLNGTEIREIYWNGINNLTAFGAEENDTTGSILTATISPSTLYTTTDANCSIYFNSTVDGNISAWIEVNETQTWVSSSWNDTAPDITVSLTLSSSVFSKHDNITCYATANTTAENMSDNDTKQVSNTPPSLPVIYFNLSSVIIGDNFNFTGSSTDADGDSLSYWYRHGYVNGSNITNWTATDVDILVGSGNENDTFRIYAMADDGDDNGTANYSGMNVTNLSITWPVNMTEYIGDTFNFTFYVRAQNYQPCTEIIDTTTYSLGNIYTGTQINSRYVFYGNHTYNVTCYSLQDGNRTYSKLVNFSNIFAVWNISIFTENEWATPLNMTGANLSVIIICEGGETYVFNFTGLALENIEPLCDVQTITAKVDYSTDSYTRERVPPSCRNCSVPMYMVDALVYTVLQIPIYMSDFNYYGALIELYKSSAGNHYTIAQGYFDVEHKYVTYLMKDNTYFIRITQGSEVRDIGYLYAATATSQYLSLSQIELAPRIRLIADNLLMSAALDNASAPTTTLRIQYRDLMNLTESVRIRVFQNINNTAFYDNTFTGISNLSVTINNVNTSFRYSVHFLINHSVLGNSPISFTIGVGIAGALADLGLSSELNWLYSGFAFFILLMTAMIIVPENRLPGYMVLIMEIAILSYIQWFAFQGASIALFIVFPVAGIIYEIRHKGVT